MKSSNDVPVFVPMARSRLATDAWLASINSSTIAESVSIAAGTRLAHGSGALVSVRAGMKSPRSTMVWSASPMSGSDRPMISNRAARLAGDPKTVGGVDERPPPRREHRARRGQLPHREPERFHGVGHHLRVADGD